MTTYSLGDLLEAKESIARPLLAAAMRSHVSERRVTQRVSDAAAFASCNVHGIGIGEKITNGKSTGDLCVRLYVVQKLPETLLAPRDLLRKSLDGIPVDVIEAPPAFAMGKKRNVGKRTRKRVREATTAEANTSAVPALNVSAFAVATRAEAAPQLAGGISIGHRNIIAGTLGYFCRSIAANDDEQIIHILSNNHVLADVNRASPGDDIFHPGVGHGPGARHVADFRRCVPIDTTLMGANTVDCAIATLRPETAIDPPTIQKIGTISGRATAAAGMKVRKSGQSTSLTHGEIDDVNSSKVVAMDTKSPPTQALFQNQIRIVRRVPSIVFASDGDSGALVVAADSKAAVGLLFACAPNGSYALANHISDVEELLQIELL